MAAFLLNKFQHPVDPNSRQGCLLLSPYDVITVQDDSWVWSADEKVHPWFRILLWAAVTVADAQALLSRVPPVLDNNGVPTTLERSRANYLDLTDVRIPAALKTWWADDTRAQPIFTVPAAFNAVSLAQLHKARPAIADPNYNGVGKPSAITS